MATLLESVQRTAVQAGDVAADVAFGVGKKAGELLSVAKLRVRIASLEGDVKDRFSQIGELLYATHTGAPTESEVLLVKLQEIDGLKAEIARMRAEIRKEEEAHTCPTCGAFVKEGDAFCGACGGKL
ncbi:zinc ribbon domain-containing protein [Dysosmobacter sp.]|uniref:zinc ribbon domain-containing protein n=1 Tax=Dysosmobacter sp. TaxID=2591382 RepID=UPI002A95342A|nr:zinc ribbon domain-containing protein [Dysosmobacter sp.]MDY5611991.1 zinc ribbon domain-containing protein [Dysosmobacter sp.]